MPDEVKQDAPEIMWIPAQRALTMLWSQNPKRHDVGAIISSLQKYGVQELPVFDATLGAIKAGNRRVECLAMMEREGMERPRGVLLQKDSGAWLIPVLGGVDAESVDQARAYAVDSNNLTMAGGDFTDLDMMRMWDEDGYKALLSDLAKSDTFTVTACEDILDELLSEYPSGEDDYGEADDSGEEGNGDSADEDGETEGEAAYPQDYAVIVSCADQTTHEATFRRLLELGYEAKTVTT